MITDSDVKKLIKEFEKVFVTKDDIKRLERKQYSYQKENVENFKIILEVIGGVSDKLNEKLDNHEQRLQNIEAKVLPSST